MKAHLSALIALSAAGCASAQDLAATPDAPACTLVIAGGALSADNEPVWRAFLDAAKPEGPLVIVPAASGAASSSSGAVRNTLVRYGADVSRIKVAELAVLDDTSTPDIDEASWAANANTPQTADLLSTAAAIWFTGGDQSRIADLLGTRDAPRNGLQAVDQACGAGAPIGGTSAGAAIMSHPMLTGGSTLAALSGETDPDAGALTMGSGLGFFPHGLVDQHFGERARLGRLTLATLRQDNSSRALGFGVDENTAMIVNADSELKVLGAGNVTIVNASGADASNVAPETPISLKGVMLHVLGSGDTFNALDGRVTPSPGRTSTLGAEYISRPIPDAAGVAAPYFTLSTLLGEGLLDNSVSTVLSRTSFDDEGRAVRYRFTQSEASEGYWGEGANGNSGYTITNVGFDIAPARVVIEAETPVE
ncbi:MAG: cyanophycinase [Pseudomonadota bacterium]